MKSFSCKEKPFKIYGAPYFEETKEFRRFSEKLTTEALEGNNAGYVHPEPDFTLEPMPKILTLQ